MSSSAGVGVAVSLINVSDPGFLFISILSIMLFGKHVGQTVKIFSVHIINSGKPVKYG